MLAIRCGRNRPNRLARQLAPVVESEIREPLARLLAKAVPGFESLEVCLLRWEEIPWDDLAFPSMHWVLRYHREVRGAEHPPPHTKSSS